MLACLADLETVIAALLTARILIQFVGQIVTVFYWRSRRRQAGRRCSGCRSIRCRPSSALVGLALRLRRLPAGMS